MKKFSHIKRLNEQEVQLNNYQSNTQQNQGVNGVNPGQVNVQVQGHAPGDVSNPNQLTPVQSEQSSVTVVKFFSKLFESREMAHMYHLQTKGNGAFAAHLALGAYYEGVIELIDELVEVYQGQYDLVEGYEIIDTKETNSKDKIAYFNELVSYIKTERKVISNEDTHLHNIIDEIVALAYKTIYKLKFLN